MKNPLAVGMETLISIISTVLKFGSGVVTMAKELVRGLLTIEILLVVIFILVTVAGMKAFGPWTRKRRPGEYPWD